MDLYDEGNESPPLPSPASAPLLRGHQQRLSLIPTDESQLFGENYEGQFFPHGESTYDVAVLHLPAVLPSTKSIPACQLLKNDLLIDLLLVLRRAILTFPRTILLLLPTKKSPLSPRNFAGVKSPIGENSG